MTVFHNKINKQELRQKLVEEAFVRRTLSFYRYVKIDDVPLYRDDLYKRLNKISVFGRIYLASEGVNGQVSVPEHNWDEFLKMLEADSLLTGIRLNIAVEDNGKSFYKLIVRTREKVVADGLDDDSFDVTNVGNHLDALEFNEALSHPDTICVDMRNHYESEVGHFEGAITPDSDTFKEELPMVLDMLRGREDKKLLLYCTGGIRCEKASAYFKHHGFSDVNQLQGGIIQYAREVKATGVENKFKGKNFVFDDRMGERIGHEVISKCHQCGQPSDEHTNCANDECHLLFIQCDECKANYNNCCSPRCESISQLPKAEQQKLRKGKLNSNSVHKSRLRPRPDLSASYEGD